MPTLDINGTQVSVDDSFLKLSHDEQNATVNEIAASMNAPKGSSVGGVAKSLGTGLAEGAIGLAGLPGDASNLLAKGSQAASNYIAGKLGMDPGPQAGGAVLPTNDSIQKGIEKYTGEFYKPQGTAEEIASKIGQFVPAAIGGPETLATKALTRVVAPALASEAGGAVAGPYGELAGALAGGAGATAAARKFQEMAAARTAAKAIPTGEDLLKSGSQGFETVKASDAVIKPSSVEQMAKDIKTELLNDGKHPLSEGQAGVFNALDNLESLGASGGGVTPKDMEVIRKRLVDAKTSLNPSAAGAARMATNSFMDKYSNLGQADLLNGSNPFPTLKNAIADYAAGKRSNTVTGKIDLAALNSGTAGSGANQDNNLRQAIKQLARPINNTNIPVAKRLGFNDPEIAAIKKAATGTTLGNAARFIGKAAPTGIVSGALSAEGGHIVGGPIGAVALPAAGYIAKKIGDLSTKKAVSAVDSLVRSRSPLAAQVASRLPPQIVQQLSSKSQRLLQTLILADPTLAQQQRQPVGQSNSY